MSNLEMSWEDQERQDELAVPSDTHQHDWTVPWHKGRLWGVACSGCGKVRVD